MLDESKNRYEYRPRSHIEDILFFFMFAMCFFALLTSNVVHPAECALNLVYIDSYAVFPYSDSQLCCKVFVGECAISFYVCSLSGCQQS